MMGPLVGLCHPQAAYVFSLGADFVAVAAGHGLEARATAAKMAATRWHFARLNTYQAALGAATQN